MDLALTAAQTMKMKMTPALYRSVEVLQRNNEELVQFLNEKVLENPLLHADHSDRYMPSASVYETAKSSSDVIAETLADEGDFRRQLHHDLALSAIDPLCRAAADVLIDSLDERGFLDEEPATILADCGMSGVDAGQALRAVQSLDPAGVGARSLIECLLLQLQRSESPDPLAEKMLTEYSECFLTGDWGELVALSGATDRDIRAAVARIRSLNPFPVAGGVSAPRQYIIPDVLITAKDGRLDCTLEDRYLPELSIKIDDYHDYMAAADMPTKAYLHKKMAEANALIYGLSRRRKTLMALAEMIMERQRDYFLSGDATALRPFTMRQAAARLSVHESTVTRAVAGKYVQTDYGIRALKKFFIRALRTEQAHYSAVQVQAAIKELIDCEDRSRPLSDQALARLLAQSGMHCSRRTVAKYRAICGIGSTIERRTG